jgi:hypothetical protein
MTATAKIPEALPVDTPASTVQSKDDNLVTITVGKGKVFYDLRKALELMGQSMGAFHRRS